MARLRMLVFPIALVLAGCPAGDDAPGDGDGGTIDGTPGADALGPDGSVNPSPALRALSAGSEMTCAVLMDGTVRCWGRNNEGQLGNGTPSDNEVRPVEVAGISDAIAVSAGVEYACALLSGGTVVCWGSGASGLLGNGSTDDQLVRVGIVGLQGVTEIATGYASTCALRSDGTVWCWGRGGELGTNSVSSSSVPVQVPSLVGVQHLANANEGGTSLRSLACAQLTGGELRCWSSDNVDGQLGTGDQNSSRTPIAVMGVTDATAHTASLNHNCAVRADGTYCWGASQFVGDGSVERRLSPVRVSTTRFAQIDGGFMHTCARETGGAVYCWGANGSGQSGDGLAIQISDVRLTPTRSLVSNAALLSVGMTHSCAYLATGKTVCWGGNAHGELGSGTPGSFERSSTPLEVVW